MKSTLLFGLFFTISICCFAQKRTITGTIYDEDKNVLADANVIVKNSNKGTITDEKGQFTLDLNEISVLEISYIGFETKEIIISKQKEVSITLKSSVETLDTAIIVAEDYNRTVSCGFGVSVTYIYEEYGPITTLFPNPSASGMFQLQLNESYSKLINENFTKMTIEVYTMSGQSIKSNTYTKFSKNSIDLSKQPKGMYLIRIVADGTILETKKAIRS